MPNFPISDDNFEKLKRLARPFVDSTPNSVIGWLTDAELERRATAENGMARGAEKVDVTRLDPDRPENLAHTRILSAKIGQSGIFRPKWNGILEKLCLLAYEQGGSFEEVVKMSGANLHPGRFEQNGYRYLPTADFSIQGVDSNLAWEYSLNLAKAMEIPLELKIEWRRKDGAARPGEVALLEWHANGA